MTKTKKRTTRALSEGKLFDLVRQFEDGKRRASEATTEWRNLQSRIVSELKRRKVKTLTSSDLMKVTLVQAETVVYNEDGLWADLSPARRKRVFDRTINLNALPVDVQRALLEHLSPAQKRKVISHKLNEDKLADAVQNGKIPVDLVSEHSEIKESAPYISVSRGSAE